MSSYKTQETAELYEFGLFPQNRTHWSAKSKDARNKERQYRNEGRCEWIYI